MNIKNNLDFIKRINYKNFEFSNNLLKLITNNKILKPLIKNNKGLILFNSINNSTKSRKTCILTSRARGNINDFKINRTQFKLFINERKLNGVKNASW